MTFVETIDRLDRSERIRFWSIAILLSPLAITAKWFGVVHGFFMYDDFDLLLVLREVPFVKSLFVFHGDGTIPLFRIFFALMYNAFGVNEFFWNAYIILLLVALNLMALAILIELGVGFVSAAYFYVVMLTASVWQLMSFGYYSLTMYHQIGLCGLVAAFFLLRWVNHRRDTYKWLTVMPCTVAPFIHVSGVYVPVSICGIALIAFFAVEKRRHLLDSLWRELRWLFLSQTAILAVFTAYFVVAFSHHGGPMFGMARGSLSFESIATSVYLFMSQGLALELFHSLVGTAMPHAYMFASLFAAIAFCGAAAYFTLGLGLLPKSERLTCAALLVPPTVIALVVGVGRRITDINYFVGSSGKYSSIALLWFTMAAVYMADCIVRGYLSSLRKQVALLTVIAIVFVVGRHVVSTNPWVKETQLRRQQLYELVDVFARYAERYAPARVHIPTLDGEFIYDSYNLLFKYNLVHYRPFFTFDARLTLLRNTAMSDWGSEAAVTVPSLRDAVDRSFVHALEADSVLQSLYCRGVELHALEGAWRPKGAYLPFDRSKISGAQSVAIEGEAVLFSTAGGATLQILDGAWDPEQAHMLSLQVTGEDIAKDAKQDTGTQIELVFSGELRIPYETNIIRIPTNGERITIDLLQLYSYALNPSVHGLVLRFPNAGRYRVSGVRLG